MKFLTIGDVGKPSRHEVAASAENAAAAASRWHWQLPELGAPGPLRGALQREDQNSPGIRLEIQKPTVTFPHI